MFPLGEAIEAELDSGCSNLYKKNWVHLSLSKSLLVGGKDEN